MTLSPPALRYVQFIGAALVARVVIGAGIPVWA